MSRQLGTFNFSGNFETLAAGPLDARTVVQYVADLTSSILPYPYNGMLVTVSSETDESRNGVYRLKNKNDVNNINSWIQLASLDTGSLVTLSSNQTIIGEKIFNGGKLKLQGYDNGSSVVLKYAEGVLGGTVVFPNASGPSAKSVAYQDWVVNTVNTSSFVTLNTFQTISGSKVFTGDVDFSNNNTHIQSEALKLYGLNSRGPLTVRVLADNGAGTVVFDEVGDGGEKYIAYQDWVIDNFTFLNDIYVTSADFSNVTDCELPSLYGLRFRINWRGYGFLIPVTEWETIIGGGFRILIPGFDVTLDPNNTFQIQQY